MLKRLLEWLDEFFDEDEYYIEPEEDWTLDVNMFPGLTILEGKDVTKH